MAPVFIRRLCVSALLASTIGCGGSPDGDGDSSSTGTTLVSTTSTSTTGAATTTTAAESSSEAGSSDPASGPAPESSGDDTSSTIGPTEDENGCAYTTVLQQDGVVKEIAYDDSAWEVFPLAKGDSFECMRVSFDLQTVDSQQEIVDMLEGCPIYLGIASIGGQGPAGERLASMLFKPWKVGCSPGDDRIEINTFVDSNLEHGPWPLGGLYHVEIEIIPGTSTVRMFADGLPLGPEIGASIEGATLDTARDPRVSFGMPQPADGAYFPDYGAVYSNLVIEAEGVPAM